MKTVAPLSDHPASPATQALSPAVAITQRTGGAPCAASAARSGAVRDWAWVPTSTVPSAPASATMLPVGPTMSVVVFVSGVSRSPLGSPDRAATAPDKTMSANADQRK